MSERSEKLEPIGLLESAVTLFSRRGACNRQAGDLHVESASDGIDNVIVVIGRKKKASGATDDPGEVVAGKIRFLIQYREAVHGDASPVRVGTGMRRRFALIGSTVAGDIDHPTFTFDAVGLDRPYRFDHDRAQRGSAASDQTPNAPDIVGERQRIADTPYVGPTQGNGLIIQA